MRRFAKVEEEEEEEKKGGNVGLASAIDDSSSSSFSSSNASRFSSSSSPSSSSSDASNVEMLREQLLQGEERMIQMDTSPSQQAKEKSFPTLWFVPPLWLVILTILILIGFLLSFTVFRNRLESCCGADPISILRYASIPGISLVFTYCHIWLALWMTFYPVEFFGLFQIPGTNVGVPGWMGIIPFKAEKMARMSVQLMTTKLLDVRDIFGRLDPQRVAKELGPYLKAILSDTLNTVARLHNPDVWEYLPHRIKQEIVEKAHEDSPEIIANMMMEVKERITEVFDIEDMVVRSLTRDKHLLNSIFIQCGYNELVFIRNSGATMGLLFGFIQMLIWFFYKDSWQLPVFGLVVGTLTNWLALKMIFQPVNPHYVCGFRIQGLFLQRQVEVSAQYGKTISKHILNAKNILSAIIAGPTTDALFSIIERHVKEGVDNFSGPMGKTAVQIAIGVEEYTAIKRDFSERIVHFMPEALSHLEEYADTALDLENTLREKMQGLPPNDFERLLHPVFEEDEWKLVVMGGVLGAVIGAIQMQILI